MENKDDIMVSVICITYNHEKFLRECLDSMVCQKTTFPFEIIVHDDVSTDGTIDIINEYKEKYPDLIVPFFEKENQYSKGKSIIEDCVLPFARGKYVAICEGDDRWCDKNKLQKQFDFMESHPDYVACFHNSIRHDLSGKKKDETFNKFKKIIDMPIDVAFLAKVHTSSYFIKKEYNKKLVFGKKCWAGDRVTITSLFTYGKLAVLPDVMSVYNNNNVAGVMKSKVNKSIEDTICNAQVLIDYYKKYNEYTQKKYDQFIVSTYCLIQLYSIYGSKMMLARDNKEYKQAKKELLSSDAYKYCMKNCSLIRKTKLFIKFHLPRKVYLLFKGR